MIRENKQGQGSISHTRKAEQAPRAPIVGRLFAEKTKHSEEREKNKVRLLPSRDVRLLQKSSPA